MVKYRKSSEHAAYEIAVGVTDRDQASELGLAVVETDAFGAPTAYGRYLDAPDGKPLGITVPQDAGTKVIGGGDVGPSTPAPVGGGKGHLVNQDDPFVHGGTGDESIHADNSVPPVVDLAAEEREAAEIAEKSIEDATKAKRK